MKRGLQNAILRNAALLVPAEERTEWLEEWKAELCYVEHDATAFCLGSYHDALWLRRNYSRGFRGAIDLDSPWRCIWALAGVAAMAVLVALPSRELWLSSWSAPGAADFVLGMLGMYLEAVIVLLTLNPQELGKYPANRHAPSMMIRMRRWVFLSFKIAMIAPAAMFLCLALLPIFPAAPAIMLIGWIIGFRWALMDQKRRCPVCLHLLTHPARIGSPAQLVLGWYGTEFVCTRGHGFLFVPEARTSWCNTQRWQYLDPSWSQMIS